MRLDTTRNNKYTSPRRRVCFAVMDTMRDIEDAFLPAMGGGELESKFQGIFHTPIGGNVLGANSSASKVSWDELDVSDSGDRIASILHAPVNGCSSLPRESSWKFSPASRFSSAPDTRRRGYGGASPVIVQVLDVQCSDGVASRSSRGPSAYNIFTMDSGDAGALIASPPSPVGCSRATAVNGGLDEFGSNTDLRAMYAISSISSVSCVSYRDGENVVGKDARDTLSGYAFDFENEVRKTLNRGDLKPKSALSACR